MPTDTSANNLNAALKLVMKSGKYKLGYRETLRTLRSGRSKLVLVSNNCPTVRQSEIEYYAMLSKTPVHRFDGGNTELGTACGRYFQVSMLTILESGDSDILQVAGN
jgi:large subunit ribosomal protein L30e|tara:strand:+ start:170 stop:490 length:321 start_codon:yes stop_codon:yes gene_type:complete